MLCSNKFFFLAFVAIDACNMYHQGFTYNFTFTVSEHVWCLEEMKNTIEKILSSTGFILMSSI